MLMMVLIFVMMGILLMVMAVTQLDSLNQDFHVQ